MKPLSEFDAHCLAKTTLHIVDGWTAEERDAIVAECSKDPEYIRLCEMVKKSIRDAGIPVQFGRVIKHDI